jgi:hypothetical protein
MMLIPPLALTLGIVTPVVAANLIAIAIGVIK